MGVVVGPFDGRTVGAVGKLEGPEVGAEDGL